MRIGAALVLASAVCGSVPIAVASSSDTQATHAYLVAQYRLVTALLHEAARTRGVESVAATQIAQECPGVVSGMPRESSVSRFLSPSPRVRGESARLAKQKETIEEELDGALEQPGDSSYRPVEEAYAAEVQGLSWSDPAIDSALQAATAASLEAVSAPAPPFCADARAWAQSGYRDLSAASRGFGASRAARRNADRTEARSLGTLLKPYENASDRALIGKTHMVESKLLVSAEAAVQTVSNLDRIVGFPRVGTKEPKQVTLGHGRTAAGTRFQVSSGSGVLGGLGCHRAATVAYTRPGAPEVLIVGGPNNPICLSSPHYRRPALFCEVGIETIQTAVPASVRSVRLVLANGRTIQSRVVRVPRRDGGPAGIYAQEIRGSTSHAVSLVELNAGGSTVLTMRLPRYRCVKRSNEPEELLTTTELASGRTPEGETFTISTFGSFNRGVQVGPGTMISFFRGGNRERRLTSSFAGKSAPARSRTWIYRLGGGRLIHWTTRARVSPAGDGPTRRLQAASESPGMTWFSGSRGALHLQAPIRDRLRPSGLRIQRLDGVLAPTKLVGGAPGGGVGPGGRADEAEQQ